MIMKIPLHIIRDITKFLEKSSEKFSIECGLPQSSVLAPTLFAIFINDIPLALEKSKSYSVLFADDLGALYIRTNTWKALENKITVYLNKLTEWLYKWRLKMNTSKCNYIVFTKGKSKKLKLIFNNQLIPFCENPKFLGVVFDKTLNFSRHYENLRMRALKRLNMIKIFSHRSWGLNTRTLKCIYTALVGSLFDYSFFSVANVSKSTLQKLQVIQNSAFRRIHHLPPRTRVAEIG